jgi:hypothetical protein
MVPRIHEVRPPKLPRVSLRIARASTAVCIRATVGLGIPHTALQSDQNNINFACAIPETFLQSCCNIAVISLQRRSHT